MVSLLRPSTPIRSSIQKVCRTDSLAYNHQHTRTFLPFPTSLPGGASATDKPHIITASRKLPYEPIAVYKIISDISSYPAFIPFCASASVTSLSKPDKHYDQRWPQRATLTIGFAEKGIQESFVSRVFCVPPVRKDGSVSIGIVEARSGLDASVTPQIPAEAIAHHDHGNDGVKDHEVTDGPLSVLRTRWTVKQATPLTSNAAASSDVQLTIEYKFRNPFYEIVAGAVTGRMAETMVAAFEKRVTQLLQNNR